MWLYGTRIADVEPSGRAWDLTMRYTAEACERWPGNSPILSCSLPLGRSRLDPTNYFRGLLPEGRHLEHLAANAGVASTDLYGLVARYGRDVAGAVVVTADTDDTPAARPGHAVPYDGDALADEVAGLDERPLAVYDDSELSIPGLQSKLLLIKTDTGWARPAGGRPSTHILKVEDRRFPGLVAAEHAAMTLAHELGLTTAHTEVVTLAGIDCIIVSRFDRTVTANGGIERIHQEDICQALGVNAQTNQGRGKYEQHGGPGLAQVAALLDRNAADPQRELVRLAQAVAFTVVIGNSDAHAKNISVLHTAPGVIELAPLYDIVPTMLWDALPDRAAMHVNGARVLSRVTVDDLIAEAGRWPLAATTAQRAVHDVVDRTRTALGSLPGPLAASVTARIDAFLRT